MPETHVFASLSNYFIWYFTSLFSYFYHDFFDFRMTFLSVSVVKTPQYQPLQIVIDRNGKTTEARRH
jgi:hypothetical protein